MTFGPPKRPRALSGFADLNTTPCSKSVAEKSKNRHAQSGNLCKTLEVDRDRCIGEEHIGTEPEAPSYESLRTKTDSASFAGVHEGTQLPLRAATQGVQLDSHDRTSTKQTSPAVSGIKHH